MTTCSHLFLYTSWKNPPEPTYTYMRQVIHHSEQLGCVCFFPKGVLLLHVNAMQMFKSKSAHNSIATLRQL